MNIDKIKTKLAQTVADAASATLKGNKTASDFYIGAAYALCGALISAEEIENPSPKPNDWLDDLKIALADISQKIADEPSIIVDPDDAPK